MIVKGALLAAIEPELELETEPSFGTAAFGVEVLRMLKAFRRGPCSLNPKPKP